MKYTADYEVTSHDVDLNDNIEPSILDRYLQETGNHQMRDRKPAYFELLDEGKTLVLTRLSVQVYKQLHQYDRIRVRTWTCDGRRATMRRCYDIVRDGEVVVEGYSEWAMVEVKSRKILTNGQEVFSNYEHDDILDLDVPKKFRFPKELEFQEVGCSHVYYDDIDMNRHMNNTNYPNLLWRYIPEIDRREVTSMNFRFMKEAPWGSDIHIAMAEADLSLAKDPAAEAVYAFRTEVDGNTNIEALLGVRHAEIPEERIMSVRH